METRWEYASANGGKLGPAEGHGEWSWQRKLLAFLVAFVVAVVAIVAVLGVWAQRRSNLASHDGALAHGERQGVRESEIPASQGPPTPLAIDADGTSPRIPRDARSGVVTARPPRSADATQAAASPTPYRELPTSLEARLDTLRQEAVEVGREAMESFPDSPEPLALLAMTHNRFGNSNEAVKCWRRLLDLDPKNAEAYAGLGTIALERGDYEESATHCSQALEADPKMPNVRAALADALMSLGQMQKAAAVLEEDLRLFPQATGSLFRLGQAYLQQGEHEKAVESFEAALRTDPDCTYAYYGISNACRHLGEREKSAEYMQTFKELKAKDLQADKQQTRDYDDEREVRRTVRLVHFVAGNIYFKHANLPKVETHWLRAVELVPRETVARGQLANLYQRQNRLPEASVLLSQLREIEPDNPLHCLNLGALHARMNHVDEAEKAFQEARRLAPRQSAPYIALAQLYLQTGRNRPEARQLAQKAVEMEPAARNYAVLAIACEENGDFAGALAAIRRAVDLDPKSANYAGILKRLEQGVSSGGRH